MDSDDFLELREYIDRRLSEFKEELMEYLNGIKANNIDEVKRELIRYLVREVGKLRNEVLSDLQSRLPLQEIQHRLTEIENRLTQLRQELLQQLQTQHQRSQQAEDVRILEERLMVVVRELVARETQRIREDEQKRRKRRVMLLINGVITAAVIIAIVVSLYPWLWLLLILILLVWLRR